MGEAVKKFKDESSATGMSQFKGVVDTVPVNVMYCDRNLVVTYINDQSKISFEKLAKYLPVSPERVLGAKIDIFHKNPEHQRKLLNNERNLPHKTVIQVGPEYLELLVCAVRDENDEYVGTSATWSIITEKLKADAELARTQNMMENAPVNVLFADRNFNVTYVNPKSKETLKKVEKFLPIPIDSVLGANIDVFHKNPSHQRNLLSNEKNLPHRAIINVGTEKLDLLVSPIRDGGGNFIGSMVTWDVVTEKLKSENTMAMMQSLVQNAPVNIMCADSNFNLVFMNPASANTLRKIEKSLAVPVDQMVGKNIDMFHKNPAVQRAIIGNYRALPHRAKIKVGTDTLDLNAAAMYDQAGNYIGPMVTWELITEKVILVRDLTEAAQQLAAASSQLNASATQMAGNSEETTGQANEAAAAAEEVSKGVEVVATNTEEMQASIKEIARNANEASTMSNETRSQANQTNAMIQKLGDSSKEIGNVVKVISSIAQQTNLLALNATIEAARAGDAGRGFAVVANEVKELAKQTATATEEITNKIGAIQGDSTNAVKAIGDIATSINRLNDIAGSIAASVEEQMATTNEVARVVGESNVGVQSIATNVKTVSTAAGQTAQGANQVLDAARGLQALAERLQSLVKRIEA
jgi:methyl-accepting chemotaxis protein